MIKNKEEQLDLFQEDLDLAKQIKMLKLKVEILEDTLGRISSKMDILLARPNYIPPYYGPYWNYPRPYQWPGIMYSGSASIATPDNDPLNTGVSNYATTTTNLREAVKCYDSLLQDCKKITIPWVLYK